MEVVNRKVTYRLYPSIKQGEVMLEMLRLHQQLYNGALEHRIAAYKHSKESIRFADQCKALTEVRADVEEFRRLNAQSLQVTLKRLDLAYSHFFRRVDKGEKAGFPRFKSFQRFKGWGYKAHGDGWRFKGSHNHLNGYLRVSGVGYLKARGRARKDDFSQSRDPGTPKTMEILHKSGKWYASVTFVRPMPERESGDKILGIDWGTLNFLTIVDSFANVVQVENPHLMRQFEDKLKLAQRELSKKKRGSRNRAKARQKLVILHQKLANKRDDHLHKTSASLVRISSHIATETLNVKAMTAKGGRYKSGLNRSVLDTAPSEFFSKLKYKAEEAGIRWSEIPTRKVKPSQSCACCGHREKKALSEREHHCMDCGFKTDRDVNAALVMINYALTGCTYSGVKVTGQELALGVESGVAWMSKHETPPIPPLLP